MPNEVYVIDGYNLLLRGFRFDTAHRDLDRQRAMLEVLLREFVRTRSDLRLIVVYDGVAPENRPVAERRSTESQEIEVIFSVPPQVADDVVIELCQKLAQKTQVTVVTSDRKDILSVLERPRIRHRLSEDFVLDMQDALEVRPVRSNSTEKNDEQRASIETPEKSAAFTRLDKEELDKWVHIFGEDLLQTVADTVVAEERSATESDPTESSPEEKTEDPLSDTEVDDWMRYFDDGDKK